MSKLYKTKCGDQSKHCEIVKKLEADTGELQVKIEVLILIEILGLL